MTRTVTDAALMMNVLAEPDPRDGVSLTTQPPDYREGLEGGVAGLRIAFSPDLGYAKADPGVAAAIAGAARAFEQLGAVVEKVGQVFDDPREPYENVFRVAMATLYGQMTPAQRALVDPGFAEMAEQGMALDVLTYAGTQMRRMALGIAVNQFFENYDLLLTPVLTLTAFDVGLEYPKGRGMRRWMDWAPACFPFNFTGHPAASVPCGFDEGGLPVGLQIVGARYADATVLRASRAYEQAHPFAMPTLPRPAPADGSRP
jgi:aspartyl-tRNA(Asn)/glutamyl-tRNA(Gln) amidotransferase subunit A